MPMYEYRCESCGHEFEKLQKITDNPLLVCPKCNASALTKLVTAAGFQLKGTGWYVTDFKNKKPLPSASTGNGDGKQKNQSEGSKQDGGKNGSIKSEKNSDNKSDGSVAVTSEKAKSKNEESK